jgi:GNAT superfamily N-acetyltransferase
MSRFVARLATAADAPELARLNALFNGSRLSAAHYAARLADPACVDMPIVAAAGDSLLGLANLRLLKPAFYEEPYAELTELFVEASGRRRGIGRALIALAERLARQAGAGEIIVLTGFYNHAALELYRALGYQHHDIALSRDLRRGTTDGSQKG